MRPWAICAIAYAGFATTLTIFDRLDHGVFARSKFCADPESVADAGRYGAEHCAGKCVCTS